MALLRTLGWLLVGSISGLLLVRSGDVSTSWGLAVVGLTTFIAVPVIVTLAVAWFDGSRTLRLAGVAVAGAYLITVSPFEAALGCGPEHAPDALTIITANVLWVADDPEGVANMIVTNDADIVVLQEVTDDIYFSLLADESLAEYSYWSAEAGPETVSYSEFFTLVISRLDALDTQATDIGAQGSSRTTFLTPDVGSDPGGDEFTFTSVHLTAPLLDRLVEPWSRQLGELAQTPTNSPSILAGDFNATEDHRPFRTLLDQGWVDVHSKKGCGLGLTYPADDTFPIPLLRLDHILVSEHFEVLSVELGSDANESDHRPVIAKVRLRAELDDIAEATST